MIFLQQKILLLADKFLIVLQFQTLIIEEFYTFGNCRESRFSKFLGEFLLTLFVRHNHHSDIKVL